MKRVSLPLLMMFVAFQLVAQTKLIAHKSHSGSKANFKAALENNLFDIGESNYGNPRQSINLKRLDSIVFVNDSTALIKNSDGIAFTKWNIEIEDKKKLLKTCTYWNSKTDTVYYTPTKKPKKAISAIKEILEKKQFDNSIDSVTFIGFDTASHKKRKKEAMVSFVFPQKGNDQPPFDKSMFWLAAGVMLSLMATALINWRKHQNSKMALG